MKDGLFPFAAGAGSITPFTARAPKNGYAYIYVSNASDQDVFFDNLKVADERGRLIEEDHYYAYGLKIAGLSSRKLPDQSEAANIKNNNLYNDKELFDDGDLDWYDYGFRNYDAQIGRFTQLDPLTDDYPELTNYQYASCEPIANVDMDGLEGVDILGSGFECVFGGFGGAAASTASTVASSAASIGTSAALSIGKTIAINALNIGLSTANNNIRSSAISSQIQSQITSNTFTTPDGGSIQLPHGASNLEFNSSSGTEDLTGTNLWVRNAPNSFVMGEVLIPTFTAELVAHLRDILRHCV